MIVAEKILAVIYATVDEMNEQLPLAQRLEKDPQTVLFGREGKLDSLGLVNFITEVEQQLEDELEVILSLADEKALSQKRSPFHTIETLSGYIQSVLDVEDNG